ncbi:septal ring lytic transglycosylase RlpA family lipoprotein [Phenylobacterium soli]|uniref:Endolytic peptidoglycan transglycosylase RlpA n=2 Tax=Phenylobacterium soli TaxID=2170551 RepID=A0A328AIP7_9CAUL|nr:septal ring lytic transglycosylase RlpA family lipoprotein [Phenylobacterium soli]
MSLVGWRGRGALAGCVAAGLLWGSAGDAAAAAHQRAHVSVRPQRGMASYYRPARLGSKMANGRKAKPGGLTAASKTLPLGAKAKVTNLETGKSVKVTVTDRGPHVKGRIVDVSPKAADKLGMKDDGVAPVKVKPLAEPPRGHR